MSATKSNVFIYEKKTPYNAIKNYSLLLCCIKLHRQLNVAALIRSARLAAITNFLAMQHFYLILDLLIYAKTLYLFITIDFSIYFYYFFIVSQQVFFNIEQNLWHILSVFVRAMHCVLLTSLMLFGSKNRLIMKPEIPVVPAQHRSQQEEALVSRHSK